MSTEAQILANQQNAQKSTGPRTPDGKTVVSQNAIKHGLSAFHDVISFESQADFDLHRDSILAELAPAGPMESILADRIVSLSWRLKRAGCIQNQTIDAMNADNVPSPLTKLTQSLLAKTCARLQTAQPAPTTPTAPTADLALGRLAIKDFAHAAVLEHLLLYERRMEHSLYRTMFELQRLQLIRKLDPLSAGNEENVYTPQLYEKL